MKKIYSPLSMSDIHKIIESSSKNSDLNTHLLGKKFIAFNSQSLWANYFKNAMENKLNIVGEYYEGGRKSESNSNFMNLQEIRNLKDKSEYVLLDFSRSPYDYQFLKHFSNQIGIPVIDFGEILRFNNQKMMYETPQDSRENAISNLGGYEKIFAKLEDELSRQTLLNTLAFKLTFDRDYIFNIAATPDNEYFSLFPDGDGLGLSDNETFADVGAYRGETIYKFMACTNFKFRNVHAFEPDKINYQHLRETKFLDPLKIHLYRAAVSDFNGEMDFEDTGTTGSNINTNKLFTGNESTSKVKVITLDDTLDELTLLKMDVEGVEANVINGASKLISQLKPKIASACYHYAEDLPKIFNTILEANDRYRFKLRHYSTYCGDSCLYAF